MTVGPGSVLHQRFEIVRALGSGAMASVWLARDLSGSGVVALKVLHPSFRRGSRVALGLEKEFSILRSLSHPGIARALGFFSDQSFVSLAIEYVEGVPLDRWIGERNLRGDFLSFAEAGRIFDDLLDAIAHAHGIGILHRDLKPANILMTEGLRPKVLDFGIARVLDGDLHDATTQGRRIGSPFYMSPEQTRGDPPDQRSDVFALGSILFELLSFRRAWLLNVRGSRLAAFVDDQPDVRANSVLEVSARICSGERPRVADYRAGVPARVDLFLARAWAVSAAERFASIAELRAAARAVLFEEAAAPRGRAWIAVLGSVAAAMIIGVVAWSSRRAPAPVPVEVTERRAVRAVSRAIEPADRTFSVEEAAPIVEVERVSKRVERPRPAAPVDDAPSELSVLAEKLVELRSSPRDSARTLAFAEELVRRADAVRDETKRRRIRRIAESSALTGDFAGLEEALDELRREVE